MPARFGMLIFAAGTLGLFLLERDRRDRTSPALWLSILWLAIGGSRNISVWLGASAFTADPGQYLEGSPLDRGVMSAMIALGVMVLMSRGEKTGDVLRRNAPLLIFFLYCAASCLWSDYPFVAFKRWTKVLGNVVMVFIVLTDPDPAAATKRFLTWTGFLLIPQSVSLIKYYPDLGRYYDRWEGTLYNAGVTTDKNLLGVICMVLGFGILTRFIEALREKGHRSRKVLAIGVVLGMDVWILSVANSATSLGCFIIGSALIIALNLSRRGRPWMVHLIVGVIASVGVVAYLYPDAFAFLVESAGRNTTLTGRTELWDDVLRLAVHPWFGAGFESFFLGDRIEFLWSKYWWHPNEAHNGYLETYLTLGIIGLSLLGLLIVSGYLNALKIYRRDPLSGSLRLAFVVIAPIYNLTEAAFKVTNPLWIVFLLAVTALPEAFEVGQAAVAPARDPERSKIGDPFARPAAVNFARRVLPPTTPRASGDLRHRTPVKGDPSAPPTQTRASGRSSRWLVP